MMGESGLRTGSGTTCLEIRLFGQVEAVVGGEQLVGKPTRRGLWLLAILALRQGKPIERQRLAGMLWPDSTDEAALFNLRQTLAALRRALGAAGRFIVSPDSRSLLLEDSPDVRVDVLEFDRACQDKSPAALEYAVSLYAEPLLAGCDEPFAIAERAAREGALLSAAANLASHCAESKDRVAAIRTLRRALAVDPYREATCRALMESLHAAGEAVAALDTYRALRTRLRRDLKVDPSAETKDLYGSIRRSISTPSLGARDAAARAPQLPSPLSVLVGRQSEVREIASLLTRCRLLTLTGVGGVGKTRLALASARAAEDRYLDGVRFVDLSPVQDRATVTSAIAEALDIREELSRPLADTLAEKLACRELLLVLDNCEHLSEGVSELLDKLLAGAFDLHVLATSRQPLGVAGELVWRVPALSTPEAGACEERLLGSEAVKLFVERSSLAGRSHPPSGPTLEAVASICRKLDGIPLAIELAAARTKVLSPVEIEARLDDRFALLATSTRTVARHHSLQAATQWSWGMLSAQEQSLLSRISVFRGGCSLEAIEAVADSQCGGAPVLDVVASLVDRSLVNASLGETSRYSLLETIRQFADEKLTESGHRERTGDAHRNFFLALTEGSTSRASRMAERPTFEHVEEEQDNLRAALDWSFSRGHAEHAARLAISLCPYWDTYGYLSEGRSRIEAALRLKESLSPATRASVFLCAGWLSSVRGDSSEACEHYRRALPIVRASKDRSGQAKVLNCMGVAYFDLGEYASAERAYREALEIIRALGRPEMASTILSNLAGVALALNDIDRAREYLGLSIAEVGGLSMGNQQQRGLTLCNMAFADYRQERYDEARDHAAEALRVFKDASLIVNIPWAMDHIALISSAFSDWARTARLLAASQSLAEKQGVKLATLLTQAREEALIKTKSALSAANFEAAFSEGREMTMSETIAYALA